jgi:hypothetical protein
VAAKAASISSVGMLGGHCGPARVYRAVLLCMKRGAGLCTVCAVCSVLPVRCCNLWALCGCFCYLRRSLQRCNFGSGA